LTGNAVEVLSRQMAFKILKITLTFFALAVTGLGCAASTQFAKDNSGTIGAPRRQTTSSQAAPLWINEARRDALYPSSEWFTGFSEGILERGDNLAHSLKQLERSAQNRMAESITLQISSRTNLQTVSSQRQQGQKVDESINQQYMQQIQTSTNAQINQAEVRSFYDPQTGRIYAFAAVNKSSLANFYRTRINILLSFVNRELALAEQLAERNQKSSASNKITVIEDTLKSLVYWNSALQIVERDNSFSVIKTGLLERIDSLRTILQSGITIYLEVLGDNELSGLSAQIQSKDESAFIAESPNLANFIVTVRPVLTRCSEGIGGLVFCFVNATAAVNNRKTGQTVNIRVPEIKGSWVNGDKKAAAQKGFEELISDIAVRIVQIINQP